MRFLLVLILFVTPDPGCAPSTLQTQIHAANTLALGANSVLPSLESAYRAEGLQAIDTAQTELSATVALERVRQRWQRVWGVCTDDAAGPTHRCHDGAWPALVYAQETWAKALEQQAAGTALNSDSLHLLFQQIHAAYCDLKNALPPGTAIAPAIVQGCSTSP